MELNEKPRLTRFGIFLYRKRYMRRFRNDTPSDKLPDIWPRPLFPNTADDHRTMHVCVTRKFRKYSVTHALSRVQSVKRSSWTWR